MNTKRIFIFLILGLLILISAQAQTKLGQYEDEAPLRTWNISGFSGAARTAGGGLSFAFARDCTAVMTNPALINSLPRFTAAVNGFFSNTSMHKFAVINTGVITSEGNPAINLYGLDFGGASYRFKEWGFSLSSGLWEIYDRPSVTSEYESGGEVLRRISFKQNGFLRNTNLSVSRSIGNRITAGIGFNLLSGNLEREYDDYYSYMDDLTISDTRSQSFSGFFLNGGITVELSPGITMAAVFRTPYQKKAEGESRSRYHIPVYGKDIEISSDEDSIYKQPFMAGAGINLYLTRTFRVTADAAFFNWRNYRVDYFGLDQIRDFKNTLQWGLGAEYMGSLRILGKELIIPMWAGFLYDPQPMQGPSSAYASLSFGFGVRLSHVFVHLGAVYGTEHGTGRGLRAHKAGLTLGYKSK